ncbi:MAG: GntR family transcriptional regulator [Nocardioides sp.]
MTSAAPHLGDAVLRPVRAHHAFEACVEQLGTAIRLGVYPRGSALPAERELAARLQVSRATLREAMAALREAGLVETTRGRGGGTVVVFKPPLPSTRRPAQANADARREWLDALAYRRIVEPGACDLAAGRRLNDEERERLLASHEAVATARNRTEHRQADSRFHLTIAALADSARVVHAVTEVQAVLNEMLSLIPVLDRNIEHSDRQHRDILDAILHCDQLAARDAMEEHCDDTAALLHGLLAGPPG